MWWYVLVTGGLLVMSAGPGTASAQAIASEEAVGSQTFLDDAAARQMDAEAMTPEGEREVRHRLMESFGVDEVWIQYMRDRQLGYGESHYALLLAEQMPGGITEANLDQLIAMRQAQHLGWAEIARQVASAADDTSEERVTAEPPTPPEAVEPAPQMARSEEEPIAMEKARKKGGLFGWFGRFGDGGRAANPTSGYAQ